MRPADAPRDYVEVRSPAAAWIARRECADAIGGGGADFLFHGRPGRAPGAAAGRAPVTRFPLGGRAAVGKRAVHGGLLGPFFGRLYLGRRRVFDQLGTALELERAGIPTPTVLAIGSSRVFGPLSAQAIVTRELDGAKNLYELAGDRPDRGRRREILRSCAVLLRNLHDAGFRHADLNLGNLVLERTPSGETLHVVDLDRGKFLPRMTREDRLGNLARLLRSYEKWMPEGLRLSRREEIYFLRCYGRDDRTLMRFLAERLTRYRSGLGPRRLRWRLAAGPRSGDRIAGPLH